MCGVVAIIGPHQQGTRGAPAGSPSGSHPAANPFSASYDVYRGLLALQHRGQDAAGILSYDSDLRMFQMEKDLGLVASVFTQQKVEKLTGNMAIGHTRYATAGSDDVRDIQPMVTGSPFGFGMIHNGNILNYYSLAQDLADNFHRQLLTGNDLEAIMHYWSQFLMGADAVPSDKTFSFDNIKTAAAQMFKTLIGGYAVVTMIAGQGIVAFRDPKGIRPLAIGVREEGGHKIWCLASETVAMTHLGYKYLRDVEPGEVILIDLQGQLHSEIIGQAPQKSHCMFEWVYFAGAESTMDSQPVYTARLRLGERLALKARAAIDAGDIEADVVMPVPDTSRPSAISLADHLNLPYREGLIKNRYIARSFILSGQDKREWAVELKLSPVASEIEGKNILLVDDSLVRGTTSKRIVSLLKKYGAKQVTLGITCPPIRYACYYGIDFPDPADLAATGKSTEQLAREIGVQKVIFLDEQDLKEAIGIPTLCMACVNGKYPTAINEGGQFSIERKKARAAS